MMTRDYKTSERVITYPYETNASKVYEPEMLVKTRGEPIAMYY